MEEDVKNHIIELLEKGENIPIEYEEILFPTTKKEYELKYSGKERKEVILNDTMSIPFQAIKYFGNVRQDEWANMLIFGDNLQVLKHLLKLKKEGKLKNADGTDGVKLIYIDPPFSTKRDFQGNKEQKAYQDKIKGAEFIEFVRKRLILILELLSDDGNLFIHLDYRKGHYIKVILDEIFGQDKFQSEIVFKRTPGHYLSTEMDVITDSIYFYSKTDNFFYKPIYQKLNDKEINEKFPYIEEETGRRYNHQKLEKSSNAYSKDEIRIIQGKKLTTNLGWIWTQETFDQRLSENPRLIYWTKEGKPRYKLYADEYEGRKINNLWDDVTLISSNSSEALDYPTQKPEALLERIIKTGSQEGDIILDCFAGSGTTGAVAEKLGRRWIMADCGKLAIYTIQKRMINLRKEIGHKGDLLKAKPFTLYNAGLYYDGELLEQMQKDEYKKFVLELFGCQKRDHEINGLEFHGTLNNYSVMVFDKDHFLTYEFIKQLHKIVGRSIESNCFIIVPAGIVGFGEDYVKEGDKKYTILRIPNSIIEYIRKKNFKRFEQPRAQEDINQTIDAVGFDFIYPPRVICDYSYSKPKGKLTDTEYLIEIKEFESIQLGSNFIEFEEPKAESIAMVMADFDYDGDTFQMDKYWFGKDIVKNSFKITFDNPIGDKIMIIYLDIFGNEKKEVLRKEDFFPR